MHLFECEATFEADPDAVWKVWTDVARWPEWDVSKEIAQLDGPFEAGTRGWARQRGNLGGAFTITEVREEGGYPGLVQVVGLTARLGGRDRALVIRESEMSQHAADRLLVTIWAA
jgi:hypothetical protein